MRNQNINCNERKQSNPDDSFPIIDEKIKSPRSSGSNFLWYKISFSCRHTGKYLASTKRKITWSFGCVYTTKQGFDEFEDHELIIIWSLKSGKAKITWNNQDISHMFPNKVRKRPPSSLHFGWRVSNGTKFKADAHANRNISGSRYQFSINDQLFSSLPSKDNLVKRRNELVQSTRLRSPAHGIVTINSDSNIEQSRDYREGEILEMNSNRQQRNEGEFNNTNYLGETRSSDSVEYILSGGDKSCGEEDPQQLSRLASAGFTYQFDMEDDLVSEMYTSTLTSTMDSLRDEVSSLVPETEEMISRAIINAFSEDHDSDISSESVLSSWEDPVQIEADLLAEVTEWLKWVCQFISPYDIHDKKRDFMQHHVENMVAHVRHDRISSVDSSKILHRIATMLKMRTTKDPKADTILFRNLNSLTTCDDLKKIMERYGNVASTAISRIHEGYGICRFSSTSALLRIKESNAKQNIEINGRKPEVFSILESPYSKLIEEKLKECLEKDYNSEFHDDSNFNAGRHHIDPSEYAIEATLNSKYQRDRSYSSTSSLSLMSHGKGIR